MHTEVNNRHLRGSQESSDSIATNQRSLQGTRMFC